MSDRQPEMGQADGMHNPALIDGPGLFDLHDDPGRLDASATSVEVQAVSHSQDPSAGPARPAGAPGGSADPDGAAPVLMATDGSCLRNPGGATGWAYVRSDGVWASAGCPEGTNQIGELQAVVLALSHHPDVAVEIQCDSSYAIGCATSWKKGWQRNNYVNSQRKTVSNLAIIRELHRLIDARTAPLTFTKVKGHDLSNRWPLNTAVDIVCGEAALATLGSRSPVSNSGVMEIDWVVRAVRSAPGSTPRRG